MISKGKIKINQNNIYNDFYPKTESSQIVDFKSNVANIIKEQLYFRKSSTAYNLKDKVLLNKDFIGIYLICVKQGTTAITELSYLPDDVQDQEIIVDGTVQWQIHKSAGLNDFKTTAVMDTIKNWKDKNPILKKGQIGVEQETCFIKVGDGVNTWNFLNYVSTPLLENKLDKNATAQKTIRDNIDNIIDETYIKDISIENTAITFTKGNGVNKTIYTKDTTYQNSTIDSDGLMSKEDKIKLNSIKPNAEENQNAFSNITVGSTTIAADLKTDTLTIKAGSNIDINANNLDDSITFSLTGIVDDANTAIKAIQDSLGQNIHETYIKNIQGDNNRLTITKGNNIESTIDINNVPNAIKASQDNRGQNIDSTYIKNISVTDNILTMYKGNGDATGIEIISFDQIYPVGCIYISVVNINPTTLFKVGTWEPLPAGRVLLAQGTSDWKIDYPAGSTGGEATHTLILNEIAPHNHIGSVTKSGSTHTHALTMQASHGKSGNGGVPRFSDGDVWSGYKTQNLSSAGEHEHAITINNSGGGKPHNNMQPYLVVYMWKRTN